MHHVSVGPLDQNVDLTCDSSNTTLARNYVTDLDEDMIDVFADHFRLHGCRLNAHSLIGQSPMLFLFGSHAHVWDNDFESYDPNNVAGTGLPNIGGDMGVRVSQTVAQIQSYRTDAPVNGLSTGTFGIVYINKLVPGVTLTLGNLKGTGCGFERSTGHRCQGDVCCGWEQFFYNDPHLAGRFHCTRDLAAASAAWEQPGLRTTTRLTTISSRCRLLQCRRAMRRTARCSTTTP